MSLFSPFSKHKSTDDIFKYFFEENVEKTEKAEKTEKTEKTEKAENA
jgi:hypothetical protein